METVLCYSDTRYEIYDGDEFIGYLQKTVYSNTTTSVCIVGFDGNLLYENLDFQVDDIEDAPERFRDVLNKV